MYQTVGHEAIDLYARALRLPLIRGDITRSSVDVGRDYRPNPNDEVEDLYDLIVKARKEVEFDAVCSGAILSDYQRVRVENV
jgi:diphthine-ammonia ligase